MSSSSFSSSSNFYAFDRNTVIVAMASRQYGEGRIFIHTDRMGGIFTGHGPNPNGFWRKVFEWTSHKEQSQLIKVGLVINTRPHATNRINSFNPISIERLTIADLAIKDISDLDCLYMVGLPPLVSPVVTENIREYIENGGGLILEYPNRGDEYINILSGIENLYCYSSERLNSDYAYWTIDGQNSYVFYNNIAFMSTLRQVDFSSEWTILMSNVPYVATTTTTTSLGDIFNFDKTESAEFAVSYISAMQNGIVVVTPDVDYVSSSSSYIEEWSSSSSSYVELWSLSSSNSSSSSDS